MPEDLPLAEGRVSDKLLQRQRVIMGWLIGAIGIFCALFGFRDSLLRTATILVTCGTVLWADHRMKRATRHGFYLRVFSDRVEVADGREAQSVPLSSVERLLWAEEGTFLVLKDGRRISMPRGSPLDAAYSALVDLVPNNLGKPPYWTF